MHKLISDSELFLRSLIEKMDVDILFECFAGILARSGAIDAENIHVIHKENYKRNYGNDIVPACYKSTFEPERYFEDNEFELLIIHTSRSSILDYLPEDFYSEPDNKDEFVDESGRKRTKDEIEKYRANAAEQLKSALRFFRPLEVEFNKFRIKRELDELDKIENFDNILQSFWGVFEIPNDRWRRFVRTLHLVSFIIGDKAKTKALIEFVLGTSIDLSFSVEEYCEISKEQRKSLVGESWLLGYNVIVGNSVYDYLDICTFTVKDLSVSEFYEYYDETSEDKKLLNEIIKYYFPLNVEVRLNFSIKPENRNTKGELAVPVLGYTSKLGN
jgi:hypothetical protein